MRKYIAIIVGKLIRAVGKAVGKGSSMPGQVALKICPDLLSRVKLPETVIAVTGSNGKTSTVEMIAHVLSASGKIVAYNREGSNQIEGVTSLVIDDCTLGGKCRSDVLLIESDERYAKYTFGYFTPTYYVITNLYRDQLTRNGHPMWVYEAVKQSIGENCRLIINSDDPLVSTFGADRDGTVYFGMDRQSFSTAENTGVYDDGKYCPLCSGRMEYEYRHYNHIGAFRCPACGYGKAEPKYSITEADLENGVLTVNGKYKITLAFRSIYNAYNILACFALCETLGIGGESIASAISNYVLKNGRVVEFTLGGTDGMLLTSKHENSVSYDQSLRYIKSQKEPHAVAVIVDAVSRKYFTSDTSWLWDIDFGMLNAENTEHIYLLGRYAFDLAARFSYTSIPEDKITVSENIRSGMEEISAAGHKKLYVITCFSDKDKLLSCVKVKGEA